jgi:hypothetical protein
MKNKCSEYLLYVSDRLGILGRFPKAFLSCILQYPNFVWLDVGHFDI